MAYLTPFRPGFAEFTVEGHAFYTMKNKHFLYTLAVLLSGRGTSVDEWFAEIEREDDSAPGTIKKVFDPEKPVLPRNMYVMAARLGISNNELAERIRRDNGI